MMPEIPQSKDLKTFRNALRLREERKISEGDQGVLNEVAIRKLSSSMSQKLYKKTLEGFYGWDDKIKVTADELSKMLREHVEKGDPVDVANFCMMLYYRQERITNE